jgi:hypothetical protein
LRCFRGIDTLTAMLILAELHDFRRFASAPALMAYLGLVPGEDSSGEKHRRGRITRTGNALVRRLLVETAWHYQHRPGIGVALGRRRHTSPPRKSRWRSRASSPASCGQRCSRSQPRRGEPRRETDEVPNGIVRRSEDGPRRRRMIRGTIARIGELAMRHGQLSQLASLDCTSSRRSTVMCVLCRGQLR